MAPAAAESASPIGIANLPNQRHKIVAKRGASFTIMVRDCLFDLRSIRRVFGVGELLYLEN